MIISANVISTQWHAYNLILPGDILQGRTSRKVNRTSDGAEFSGTQRVQIELGIKITKTSFDPITCILRASGGVVTENDYAPLGSHHSLEIEAHHPFMIVKPEGWDSVASETLQEALSDDKNGALAAVVMQEGLANICLITQFRTVHKTKVEHVVPKKRDEASHQDAGMRKFFEKTLASLMRAADFKQSRPLLIASPGFVAADFQKYIASQGRDKGDKALTGISKMATIVHSASGHVHSLNEVLKSPEVLAKMKDTRYAREIQLLDSFFDKLKMDDGRAWYGAKAVTKAVDEGAVSVGGGVLLINNSLFRSEDLAIRKRYVALVDKVKTAGGEVSVLSSDHESGNRLHMLGDIAAILTYPILDLDEEDEEEDERDEAPAQQRHYEDDTDMLSGVI